MPGSSKMIMNMQEALVQQHSIKAHNSIKLSIHSDATAGQPRPKWGDVMEARDNLLVCCCRFFVYVFTAKGCPCYFLTAALSGRSPKQVAKHRPSVVECTELTTHLHRLPPSCLTTDYLGLNSRRPSKWPACQQNQKRGARGVQWEQLRAEGGGEGGRNPRKVLWRGI